MASPADTIRKRSRVLRDLKREMHMRNLTKVYAWKAHTAPIHANTQILVMSNPQHKDNMEPTPHTHTQSQPQTR